MNSRPTFTLLESRQRWVRIGGAWYREYLARRSDGVLRIVAVLDDAAVAA